MPLETVTYISDLVPTNPIGGDAAATVDDHLRLIKKAAKNTFPDADKPFRLPQVLTQADYNALSTKEQKFYVISDAQAVSDGGN